MATYNGGKFIAEQLDSLANQTFLPSELIVSDDRSSDNTLQLIRDFSKQSPFPVRIKVNTERLGYGANFLNASRHARSKYISFCDQDDVWYPNKLEVSVRCLEQFGADLYVHAATIIDQRGDIIGSFTQDIKKKRVVDPLKVPPWGVFYGFSMVFQRDLLDTIDPDLRGGHTFEFSGLLSHDLWIYFVATSLGKTIVDPQRLVRYRRHNTNQTPGLSGTFLSNLSQWLGTSANQHLRRDVIAKHRSKILSDLHSSRSNSKFQLNSVKASKYWDQISKYEELRIPVYRHSRTATRTTTCIRVLLSGGYRTYSRGGLGWRLFLKDVLFGVLQLKRIVGKS